MSYWADPKPIRRTRAVEVDHLAREALVLLDEGGLPAVTVRSLAGRLGVAPPSLYSRIRSVDDILDLALDHALDDDEQVWHAAEAGCPHRLLLALYDHLCRHCWAAQVIGLRAPRGPAYLCFSERLLLLLVGRVADPLSAAYAVSNFVIGSATTAASADDEPTSPVNRSLAPTYAMLHAEHAVEAREIVDAGLRVLLAQ